MSSRYCQRRSTHRPHFKCTKIALNFLRHVFVADSLKHLAKNDIRESDSTKRQLSVQPKRFWTSTCSQIVNPYRGIDDHHSRARRVRSRSPSHLTLPRWRRILACAFVSTSSCNPASTAARLVRAPLNRMARRIRASSISIFAKAGGPYADAPPGMMTATPFCVPSMSERTASATSSAVAKRPSGLSRANSSRVSASLLPVFAVMFATVR